MVTGRSSFPAGPLEGWALAERLYLLRAFLIGQVIEGIFNRPYRRIAPPWTGRGSDEAMANCCFQIAWNRWERKGASMRIFGPHQRWFTGDEGVAGDGHYLRERKTSLEDGCEKMTARKEFPWIQMDAEFFTCRRRITSGPSGDVRVGSAVREEAGRGFPAILETPCSLRYWRYGR